MICSRSNIFCAVYSAQLQTLLTPNITLFAKMSDGTELQTTLSTDDATFVNGVFSNLVANETTNTTTTASAAATPFKLPGTRIEIVPIGLYFYGSYMALACIIFGYGKLQICPLPNSIKN